MTRTMTERRHQALRRPAVRTVLVAALTAGWTAALAAATLQDETLDAWHRYVRATETRISRELGAEHGVLGLDARAGAARMRRTLLEGNIIIEKMSTLDTEGKDIDVPSGEIHHWRGALFVPGITLDAVLTTVRRPLSPEDWPVDVVGFDLLEVDGDRMRIHLRLAREKLVTVYYDTEHVVEYTRHDESRASSRSVATKIAELEHIGTGAERERPIGHDRGFLWRMNSYWRYEAVRGGVIVECESMMLSRSIPAMFRWMVAPLVTSTARESMQSTLSTLSMRLNRAAGRPAS